MERWCFRAVEKDAAGDYKNAFDKCKALGIC